MAVSSLSIYRNMLEDRVVKKFVELIDCLCMKRDAADFINLYSDFFFTLVSCGPSFANYIIEQIIYDDNPFSRRCAAGEECGLVEEAAERDLNCLQHMAEISPAEIKASAHTQFSLEQNILSGLPEWEYLIPGGVISHKPGDIPAHQVEIWEGLYGSRNWSDTIPALKNFYRKSGAGIFARYYAFNWEHGDQSGFLKGVPFPDPVRLSDLFGYENERREVLENTLQFLKGYPANNALLYGNRGTGKSSTVKALVNEYHSQGLRIIEVSKALLSDFPAIIRRLRGSSRKFIIFVDDLTFEDSSDNYTALKAVLEGGLEMRPSNVLIYATSNRRHLIKEKFSDRFEPSLNKDDEIHKNDGVQEKLSLADRFGITVLFTAPDQEKYLSIVHSLAVRRSIQVMEKDLNREALQWAARHNGLSPRSARQFIDWLQGHLALI